MKTKILILLLSLLLSGNIKAWCENPKMTLGCPIVDLPKNSTTGTDKAGTVKSAMLVTPDFSQDIKDFNLVGVRFGLTSKINISEVEVWATYSLEEEPFVSQKVTEIKKGWNYAELSVPASLEQKPFYTGYTITTEGACYPVAKVDADYEHEMWIDNGNGWNRIESESFEMLAIGAVVSGENLPQYDLSLISVELPGYLSTRNTNPLTLELRNVGGLTVNGFTITCEEGEGENSLKQSFDFDEKIDPNFSTKVTIDYLPLSGESETLIPFNIAISSLKDGADYNMADNNYSSSVRVSPFSFKKRALVEEFTTEVCSNCPRAVKLLHDVLSEEYYWQNVIAVCHHAGYYTDFLTQPCDEDLLPLFGESSFAPAMAFDRAVNNSGVVVSNVPLDAASLKSTFDKFISDNALADMIIDAKWNVETRKLDVSVDGGSLMGEPVEEADRVTVYLLEDNVAPQRQSNADADFMHHHVIRAYNSSWGNKIEWNENGRFDYKVSFDVPDVVNIDNCEVVAILGHVNASNVMDCQIHNANRCEKIDWSNYTSGVSELPQDDEIASESFYDLTGLPVAADAKGILIKVTETKNGLRKVTKLVK